MKKRTFISLFGVLVCALSLMPTAVYGIWNEGVWGLFLFGVAVAVMPFLYTLLPRFMPKAGLLIWKILLGVLCAGTACVIALLILMQTYPTASATSDVVVVLGCQVKDGRPSRMLLERLKVAERVLTQNPDAVCVVSGGQGGDEAMSEAECMKQWLVQSGIDEKRIIKEEQSTDTNENLRFSADILRQNDLGTDITLVTDAFHAYRASLCAGRYGLIASVCPSYAPWFIQQSYWFREILGLMKFWFLE